MSHFVCLKKKKLSSVVKPCLVIATQQLGCNSSTNWGEGFREGEKPEGEVQFRCVGVCPPVSELDSGHLSSSEFKRHIKRIQKTQNIIFNCAEKVLNSMIV